MAHGNIKKASRPVATLRDDSDDRNDAVYESPLGNIHNNAISETHRLRDIYQVVSEMANYLGIGEPGEECDTVTPVPYGKLEEILDSQKRNYTLINDIESVIYSIRRSLM